jgi:hypothetical protein
VTGDQFLGRFFGPGNHLSLDQVDANGALAELVADLTDELAHPVVLPRRTSAREVEWFVLTRDDTTFRRVQAEVQAFIGPSYGRWDGVRAELNPDDPIEQAVAVFAHGHALRFRTASDEEFREAWTAIKLMRAAWHQRPTHRLERVQTGATLVREFELAVAAGDPATASNRVAELRRRGLLGAENVRFLEVRGLAAQGRWGELAAASDLSDLARIRRPWLVTEDLLTALYRTRVATHEQARDTAGAIAQVRAIVDELPELFATRGPLRTPDVAKLFALRFALPGREDAERARELAELPGLHADDRAWIRAIVDGIVASPGPARSAHDAFREGDLDAAFALAVGEPPSVRRAELLVECAFEVGTLHAARTALAALDELDDDARAALLHRRLVALAVADLRALADLPKTVTATPATWTGWLETFLEDAEWPAAEAVARVGELEYAAADLLDVPAAERLAELMLAAADSPRRETFKDALPRVVGWLERQEVDAAVARPVQGAVLTVLALDDAWRETSLEVAYNVLDALVRAGLDPSGYDEVLDQLGLLWGRMASRAHVAWLADVLELLEMHPGPRAQQLGFVVAAIARVMPFVGRIDPVITAALATSCNALGAADQAAALRSQTTDPEAEEGADAEVLRDRLVGIYTLTPQVGRRAREAIERRFPGVRVQVDSSHVSTASLEQLAASADYLIVSIRSAKHAATDAIERHRPREMPTLIPRGRGSSRMLEALITAVPDT